MGALAVTEVMAVLLGTNIFELNHRRMRERNVQTKGKLKNQRPRQRLKMRSNTPSMIAATSPSNSNGTIHR